MMTYPGWPGLGLHPVTSIQTQQTGLTFASIISRTPIALARSCATALCASLAPVEIATFGYGRTNLVAPLDWDLASKAIAAIGNVATIKVKCHFMVSPRP